MSKLKATLGGVAVVCCVHDREKRQIVTEASVARLGASIGVTYDPAQHKLFGCSCCENLFVGHGDEPCFCHACSGPLVHTLAAPLPAPTGRI